MHEELILFGHSKRFHFFVVSEDPNSAFAVHNGQEGFLLTKPVMLQNGIRA